MGLSFYPMSVTLAQQRSPLRSAILATRLTFVGVFANPNEGANSQANAMNSGQWRNWDSGPYRLVIRITSTGSAAAGGAGTFTSISATRRLPESSFSAVNL